MADRIAIDLMTWSEEIAAVNRAFTEIIDTERLPIRIPGPQAVITCMDPRVNLAAVGIPEHGPHGELDSTVRIVRTLGGRADDRSLAALIYLAGALDILVLTHTDCGATIAHRSIPAISERIADRIDPTRLAAFRSSVGANPEALGRWFQTFADPEKAAETEVVRIRRLDFVPADVSVTGAVYDVTTGRVKIVATV